LLCKKPVINPLYDSKNRINPEFLRLYNSSFYKRVSKRKDVIATYNINETVRTIERISAGEVIVEDGIDDLCNTGIALKKFIQVVS